MFLHELNHGCHVFKEMYSGLLDSKRDQVHLRDVVLSRLIYPCSKKSTQRKLENILVSSII